jgi:hypothetical protein
VLDYCLHQGSENVVIYFRDNLYVIKTLKEFQYIDEDGKDQGANVRQKAKDITNLLTDEGRLREERRTRAHMRDRMLRGVDSNDNEDDENAHRRESLNGRQSKKPNRDEDELKRAIEESKRSLANEQKDREDKELEEALRLSKDEEEKRKKEVENSNASALFDDASQMCVFHYSNILTLLLRYLFFKSDAFQRIGEQSFVARRSHPLRDWLATAVHYAASIYVYRSSIHRLQPVPTTGRTRGRPGRIPSAATVVSASTTTGAASAAAARPTRRMVTATTTLAVATATAAAATESLCSRTISTPSTYWIWVRCIPFFFST